MKFKIKKRKKEWPKYYGNRNEFRIVKKFLLFPRIFNREFRWLETAYWLQYYEMNYANYNDLVHWYRGSGFLTLKEVKDTIESWENKSKIESIK
jgi:hypothetical protein